MVFMNLSDDCSIIHRWFFGDEDLLELTRGGGSFDWTDGVPGNSVVNFFHITQLTVERRVKLIIFTKTRKAVVVTPVENKNGPITARTHLNRFLVWTSNPCNF